MVFQCTNLGPNWSHWYPSLNGCFSWKSPSQPSLGTNLGSPFSMAPATTKNLVISAQKKSKTDNHFKEPILKSILIPIYEEICWQMFPLLGRRGLPIGRSLVLVRVSGLAISSFRQFYHLSIWMAWMTPGTGQNGSQWTRKWLVRGFGVLRHISESLKRNNDKTCR